MSETFKIYGDFSKEELKKLSEFVSAKAQPEVCFEAKDRRIKMLEQLEKHITDMLSFTATAKDADGIEKLMRFYFEQLDKMNP